MHGFLSYGKKSHPIINFATGKIATDDMKYDFIDLKERGEFSPDGFVGKFTQESTKLNYYDPIKRQPLKLFEKKTIKKKHSKPEDEYQSFTNIFAMYDEKKLDLNKIMYYWVTSKPWAIFNEDEKSSNNNKHLLRNHLQNLSPIPKTHIKKGQYIYFNSRCNTCCKNNFCCSLKIAHV